MSKMIRLIILVSIISLCLGAPPRASAQSPWPPGCQFGSLPSNDPQYPADQLIVICIPPSWNGMLVMYAHGYVAAQLPLALPTDQLAIGGVFMPNVLLAQGFAFATTSYHKNGYAVEQASKDLINLLAYFKTRVHRPLLRAFLVGASEGGEIVTMMIERHPFKFAGALALCGPISGATYQVKYLSDFRVVFDYFFRGVFPFGAANVPPDAYLSWPIYDSPTGKIATAIASNPAAALQLYRVTGAALNPANSATAVSTALSILWYSVFGTNDLLSTAGGMPYDNRATVYSGSADDAALNAGVERVPGIGQAKLYLQLYFQPTGILLRPLVTLHNPLDPVVPYQHEIIYQKLVTRMGFGKHFTSIQGTTPYGHCNFSADEINAAFATLVQKASMLMDLTGTTAP
jgi:pimeloyl-ACP methyl ester carboxylesterase